MSMLALLVSLALAQAAPASPPSSPQPPAAAASAKPGVAPSKAAVAQGRALAKRIQAFYARTRDFTAAFAQHYTYAALGKVEDSTGTVRIKKPGLVRWDYDKPEVRSLFLQGRTLWIWKPEDKEAVVNRKFGGEELSSAFTFLWGKGDLLREFEPRAVARPQELPEGDALELKPKKPVPGVVKLLFVVGKSGEVLASVVTNAQADQNQIVFSQSKVDQGLEDSLFHFEPPKGAYVQEL